MKYKTEIFDYSQYLFQCTGFNDHQLHGVIQFENKIDASVLEKAVHILINTVPILARRYQNYNGNSYWEDTDKAQWNDLFQIVDNENAFEQFTFSKLNKEKSPQVKVCLLQSDSDSISIIMNHMVTDGAGFKKILYLLSDIYTNILKNPNYTSDAIIDGDRSPQKVISNVKILDKLKILLRNSKVNNQSSKYIFPMSKGKNVTPFIMTHQITPETYEKIQNYCKKYQVTVNDVLLTTYFRVLSKMLANDDENIGIPIMIDMRKYAEDKDFDALTNLTSMEIINAVVYKEEDFYKTLTRVSSEMKVKKDNYLGMNLFLKLDVLFKICGRNFGYKILKRALNNPNICMTNIGIIDSSRLVFEKSKIQNAYVCGSIKYRPHFQMAVSTYRNRMTLSVNLYGSQEDKKNISEIFKYIDDELDVI